MNLSRDKYLTSESKQSGQTLVETMVAALVLSIGIGAAISLAIYGLAATTAITNQLVGVGLAREGIEAVKNMRDTNWLRDPIENTCHNFYNDGDNGVCYQQWLTGNYNIDPGAGPQTYTLSIAGEDPENEYWRLYPTANRFGLDYNPSADYADGYYYYNANVPVENTNSGYARRITLQKETFAPFNESTTGPRLKVTVDVWWKGRRCPAFTATPPTGNNCRITLETYLTNWKDYE